MITDHCCLQTRGVRLCTVSWLAKEIEAIVQESPNISLAALVDIVQKNRQVHVTINQMFRAKVKATTKLAGSYVAQYGKLRDYCEELLRSNPGSTIKIDVERECNSNSPTRQFRRIYICLAGLKEGWKLCGREIIGLDGCFMKGPFPGQILTAVGVDGNNGIYPVAYALVEAETMEAWSWFLVNLGNDLNIGPNSDFTFISDRQKVSFLLPFYVFIVNSFNGMHIN